jgi:hypothetical protein
MRLNCVKILKVRKLQSNLLNNEAKWIVRWQKNYTTFIRIPIRALLLILSSVIFCVICGCMYLTMSCLISSGLNLFITREEHFQALPWNLITYLYKFILTLSLTGCLVSDLGFWAFMNFLLTSVLTFAWYGAAPLLSFVNLWILLDCP